MKNRCKENPCCGDPHSCTLNTRPAAPVEGLETVRFEYLDGSFWRDCDKLPGWYRTAGFQVRELVTRSQAEAIIAAKEAEIVIKRKANDDLSRMVIDLQSDNAALTAQKNGLHDEVQFMRKAAKENRERAEAIETQLASGTVTFHLKWIAGARPPIHPEPMNGGLSFGDFDVAIAFMRRQAADAKFVSLIERTEIRTDRSQEARATLEAKP